MTLHAAHRHPEHQAALTVAASCGRVSCRLLSDWSELNSSAMQGPLQKLTSRPSIACLRDMNAANVELMRAIKLEHEAYGQLSFVFSVRVGPSPLQPLSDLILIGLCWACVHPRYHSLHLPAVLQGLPPGYLHPHHCLCAASRLSLLQAHLVLAVHPLSLKICRKSARKVAGKGKLFQFS